MILPVITLIFCCAIYGKCMEWKERNLGNTIFSESDKEMETTKCLDLQEEFCKTSQDATDGLTGHFLRKKASPHSFSGISDYKRIIPFHQSFHQCPCSCKMDYPLMDLGKKYFPRYIQIGVCKADSCGSHHRCVEKKYKMVVIKQKDFSDQEIPDTKGLPPSLQDSWISETVGVSIACECLPIV